MLADEVGLILYIRCKYGTCGYEFYRWDTEAGGKIEISNSNIYGKAQSIFRRIYWKWFFIQCSFSKMVKNNTGKTLEEAIKCWKYKRQLQGHNRYESWL